MCVCVFRRFCPLSMSAFMYINECARAYNTVTGLNLFRALFSSPLRLTVMLLGDSVVDKPLWDSIQHKCTFLGTKLKAALAPGNINAPFKPLRICP